MPGHAWISEEDDASDRALIRGLLDRAMTSINALKAEDVDAPTRKALAEEARLTIDRAFVRWQEFYTSARNLKKGNDALKEKFLELKEEIEGLKGEIDKLSAPPLRYATYHSPNGDDTVNIIVGGVKFAVYYSSDVNPKDFKEGQEVVVNGTFAIVRAAGYEIRNLESAKVKAILDDGRVIVTMRADEERVGVLAGFMAGETLKVGDGVTIDSNGYIGRKLPKSEVDELELEEAPDVTYADIGGLDSQIEVIQDTIELPYLYPDEYREHQIRPSKGVLLYGPPGCGKTMIAKAIANRLAEQISAKRGEKIRGYFLNIKGPELLNKWVGETERKIREIFVKAREKASEDFPVVVFFDEMDSIFRVRGSGVSSDVEITSVSQLLAELDGLVGLKNIVVIGATNRQDLIDPGVLRPGRMDGKIRIDRPDIFGAMQIFMKYLKPDLPFHPKLLNFGRPYVVPNRLKELLPGEWAKLENNLAHIREQYGIVRREIGKRRIDVDRDGFAMTFARLAVQNPDMAKYAQSLLDSQPEVWEHEEFDAKSPKDVCLVLAYRAVEAMFMTVPDKTPIDEAHMWISAEGELVQSDPRFLKVTYRDAKVGEEILYHKDFASGAMIESIVRRAKKSALKRYLTKKSPKGIKMFDLWCGLREEASENEDLPNTTNPDDWARVIGQRGEIALIRPLFGRSHKTPVRGVGKVVNTGQYL